MVKHAKVNHVTASIETFYSVESLGVECNTKCGEYRCLQCESGGKSMKLEEERESKMIDENITYLVEKKKWHDKFHWTKDPKQSKDNKPSTLIDLKSIKAKHLPIPECALLYKRHIEDMIVQRKTLKLSEEYMNRYGGPTYYMLHDQGLKRESKGTPGRIALNSCTNYHSHVLNEFYEMKQIMKEINFVLDPGGFKIKEELPSK